MLKKFPVGNFYVHGEGMLKMGLLLIWFMCFVNYDIIDYKHQRQLKEHSIMFYYVRRQVDTI
jgi:hypothetical protein